MRELKHTKKQIESNEGTLSDERGSEEVDALLRLLSAFIDVQQGYFELVDMIREGGSVQETHQSADDIDMDARLDEQKRALDKYNRVT